MKPLKTFALTLLLTAATLLSGLVTPLAAAEAAVRPHVNRAVAPRRSVGPNYGWQMYAATNASRRRMGLPRLVRGKAASKVALAHSRAMANTRSLYHSQQIAPYLAGAGRVYMWGENIGWTTGGVPDLERAFMASPDHRTHILSPSFRHVAVGAVRRGHRLWVTLFFYS
jgi:uncharacterized protein YkwD